jgi:acetylglutamate synthase
MLQKFHMGGRLTKTPVSNVTMIPRRGVRWPLTEVISAMGSQENLPQGFDELDAETKAEVAANLKRFNLHDSNMAEAASSGVTSQASSLLEMAKMLEADAQAKREQAYRMDPNLRPSVKKAAAAVALAESLTTESPTNEPVSKPTAKKKKAA